MFGRKEKLELAMQASTIRILEGRLNSMTAVVADLRRAHNEVVDDIAPRIGLVADRPTCYSDDVSLARRFERETESRLITVKRVK